MGAVDGGAVAKADPVLEHGRLARVDVQAAKVLDVAFSADHDLVVVGAQHGSVPDRGGAAEGDPADEHRAGGNPGVRMDDGTAVTQRSD